MIDPLRGSQRTPSFVKLKFAGGVNTGKRCLNSVAHRLAWIWDGLALFVTSCLLPVCLRRGFAGECGVLRLATARFWVARNGGMARQSSLVACPDLLVERERSSGLRSSRPSALLLSLEPLYQLGLGELCLDYADRHGLQRRSANYRSATSYGFCATSLYYYGPSTWVVALRAIARHF